MNVNKIIINTSDGRNIGLDLTQDTVTPESLVKGHIAHNAAGKMILGSLQLINVEEEAY